MKLIDRLLRRNEGDCAALQEHFQTHLDHELDEETSRQVADHLERCKDCGLEYETYQELKASIERMRRPSDDAVARLGDFAETVLEGHEPMAP